MEGLKLEGSDTVLGVDWLNQFNPVLFDFYKGSITFNHGDTKLVLSHDAIKEEC